MMTTMSEMINFECMARKAQPPPPSSGWVVAWRRCLDGSTILVQVPTRDAKLDARGYMLNVTFNSYLLVTKLHFVKIFSHTIKTGLGLATLIFKPEEILEIQFQLDS